MSRNAFAVRDALRAGHSGIGDDARSAGEFILRDLRAALSTPYPPASAPGHDPHARSRELLTKYDFDVSQPSTTSTVLAVYSPTEYAVYLEFGTRYMAARPHLRVCVTRNYGVLRDNLKRGIEARERASGR